MEVFNFPNHLYSTERPVSGAQITLGNSYQYAVEPTAPDQRNIHLTFRGLWYYKNSGGVIDETIDAENNMAALESFYNRHRLWKNFQYTHPIYGLLTVRFSTPLSTPNGTPGGTGIVEGVQVKLIEQP